jgi:predicted nucleic acid-binding protein
MGLLDEIQGPRIYLDTNIFIYAVEGFDRFEEEINSLFIAVDRGERKALDPDLDIREDHQ